MGNKNFNKQELPHELFLTTRQITKLRNKIGNNMSADIKLSKAQLKKPAQSGGIIIRLLGRILPKLTKPVFSTGKNLLAPLGLSAMSAADAGIQKSIFSGSGITTLKFGNNELNDLMKIIKILEDHNILLKGITKTAQNEVKSQRGGFLSMLMGTLGASLLGDILSRGLLGKGIVRAGEGIKKSLMPGNFSPKNPPHPLTNFEIMDYFKNEPKFNGVYSRNNQKQ